MGLMHKVNDIPPPVCGKVKWNMIIITFFIQISCEKRTMRTCGRNDWTGNVSER